MKKINDIRFQTKSVWKYNSSCHSSCRNVSFISVSPHWHEYFELELFLNDGTTTINDKVYPITRNSLVLVTPTDIHSYQFNSTNFYRYSLGFDYTSLESPQLIELLSRANGTVVELSPDEAEWVKNIWAKLDNELLKTHQLNRIRSIILIELLLCEVFSHAKDVFEDANVCPVTILKALRFIQQHFREPISVKDVADSVWLSENYFSQLFHENLGMTFVQYLNMTRLKYACNLLVHTSDLVQDIASASGYNNLAYFQKMFKRAYSMTPSEYRKKEENPDE